MVDCDLRLSERTPLGTSHPILTVDVELSQGVHDGEEAVPGEGGQREDGHAYADVLGELGDGAQQGAVGPRGERVHGGGQRHGGDYDQ